MTLKKHIKILGSGAAPELFRLPELIRAFQARGYSCDVVLTPTAYKWMKWHDMGEQDRSQVASYLERRIPGFSGMWPEFANKDGIAYLEELTGHKVWSEMREFPGKELPKKPKCDAVVAFAATVRMVGAIRSGDGYCLAALSAIDRNPELPLFVLPYSNEQHLRHPGFIENIDALESWKNVDIIGKGSPQAMSVITDAVDSALCVDPTRSSGSRHMDSRLSLQRDFQRGLRLNSAASRYSGHSPGGIVA